MDTTVSKGRSVKWKIGPIRLSTTQPRPDIDTRNEKPRYEVDWNAVQATKEKLARSREATREDTDTVNEGFLPDVFPQEVRQIGAVFLSRCNGYVRRPSPWDVQRAIAKEAPSEQEEEALVSFLVEAEPNEVERACQNGEIDLEQLMRKVEQRQRAGESRGIRGVRRWLTRTNP